jgi:acetyl esterase
MMRLRDRLELALGRRLVRLPTPLLRSLVRAPVVDGLDPHVHAVLVLFDRLPRRKFHRLAPPHARAEMARLPFVLDGPAPAVGAIHEARAAGLPIRIYRPPGHGPWPVLVYFHGGGGVVGSLQTHDVPCRILCRRAGCVVASVDYRLAPEHPFPAAVDDALEAYRWARSGPEALAGDGRVAVGGDSMGGCLAAVVMHEARTDPAGAPDAALLVYPVVDPRSGTPSRERFGNGFLLTTDSIDWFEAHYLGDADPLHPRAAPGRVEDLRGLPPTIVATAGFDPLRDEAETYAEALAAAGVQVEHRCFADQVHGFLHMTSIASARAATFELADALRRAFERH